MKKALVLGAGGFIGSHLVKRLKQEGYWIRGVDLKEPEFSKTEADEFVIGDLRNSQVCHNVMSGGINEIYQLAAEMGGAGYVFTGENDANIMHNSAIINLNILNSIHKFNLEKGANKTRIFYSSSACVYPEHNQRDPENPKMAEDSAYPAQPGSEYGWEKLFSERLYLAFHKNYGIDVRIARYGGVFGPEGSWNDGREKAVAALCRKIAEAENEGYIEIWGDGLQTRSFLYVDECLNGTMQVMRSDHKGPFNIGSDHMITINELALIIMKIAGKKLAFIYTSGPQGVRGRTSDNKLIFEKLGWKPNQVETLEMGLRKTYPWILEQVKRSKP